MIIWARTILKDAVLRRREAVLHLRRSRLGSSKVDLAESGRRDTRTRRCSCLLVVDCGEHGGETPLLDFWAKLCSTDIIMSAKWVASFSKIFVSGLERLC